MLVSSLMLPFVVGSSHGPLFLSSLYLLPIHHDVTFQEMLRSWSSFFGNTRAKKMMTLCLETIYKHRRNLEDYTSNSVVQKEMLRARWGRSVSTQSPD